MSIRKYYILTGVIFISVLLAILATLLYAVFIQQQLNAGIMKRQNALDNSMELFHSSEELTRFARLYVITGNPIFKDMYYEVLDIRNGKVARPVDYSPAYWYLHDDSFSSPNLERTDNFRPLNSQIINSAASQEEKDLLILSQKNSDQLVLMEEEAFAMMSGLSRQSESGDVFTYLPKQAQAIKLLFSKEYNFEKQRIMKPIQKFIKLQRERVDSDVIFLETKLLCILIVAICGVVFWVGLTVFWIKKSIIMIHNPLNRMHLQINSLIDGDYSSRCDNLPNNEIGFLGEHFNEMADQLEADIQKHREAELILRKSEDNIRSLVDSSAEAVFGLDMEGKCTFANAVCVKLLGYDCAEDFIGKNIHDLIHHTSVSGKHIDFNECKINKAFKHNRKIHVADDVFFRKNGTYFEVEYWSYPLITESEITGAVVTFIDITKSKKVQNHIKDEIYHLKTILQVSRVGTWEYHIETGVVKVNNEFREILEYTLAEMDSIRIEDFYSLIHNEDIEKVKIILNENYYRASHDFHQEFRIRNKNAEWVWVLGCGTLVCNWKNKKMHVITGTITDITLRKNEEERVRYLADHDALTDLPNRRYIQEKFVLLESLAQRHKSKMAIFFIDLYKFKPVNDKYGHDFGDEVLRVVGARLKNIMRKSDIVARLGGDEFIVLSNDLKDINNLAVLKGKLVNVISEVIIFKGAEIRVGASIGTAVYPDNGQSFEVLVDYADNSMYIDKQSHGSR